MSINSLHKAVSPTAEVAQVGLTDFFERRGPNRSFATIGCGLARNLGWEGFKNVDVKYHLIHEYSRYH